MALKPSQRKTLNDGRFNPKYHFNSICQGWICLFRVFNACRSGAKSTILKCMCEQNKYVDNIKPMVTALFKETADADLAIVRAHEQFRSSLGEVAWTAMTIADLAVYIQSLQRRSHAPRGKDCRRVNLVMRYLRRQRVGIFYAPVPKPWRVIGYSDSAFGTQEDESTGLALRGLAILLVTEDSTAPTSPSDCVNMLDFLVRRLRWGVRSAFARR